ncbi:hypothetical protein NQ317_012098 [Molorchus minor]|uniref:Protein-cysteine N-palmitoyltransferase Rasp n=1 Tax=Molorchus minor TaxID=1323400 RepID=A0ABQ9J5P7_9CUCU|nr:hypothetical protein NQ317_012098 [Molorchus minor]
MGQHFHIKYIVLYGLSTTCASFENVNVPHLPRCIGRIHLYSDMWKYFDRGLYKYLVRHIYIPTMKIVPYKFLASLLCFLFVYIWHGVETYILIWSLLNYFGVCLEYMCASLKHKYFGMTKYSKAPDGQWFRRFKCLLTAPLLALSAISNFYFFAGTEIGNTFFLRIITESLTNTVYIIVILYCCCQVSEELRTLNAKKILKNDSQKCEFEILDMYGSQVDFKMSILQIDSQNRGATATFNSVKPFCVFEKKTHGERIPNMGEGTKKLLKKYCSPKAGKKIEPYTFDVNTFAAATLRGSPGAN